MPEPTKNVSDLPWEKARAALDAAEEHALGMTAEGFRLSVVELSELLGSIAVITNYLSTTDPSTQPPPDPDPDEGWTEKRDGNVITLEHGLFACADEDGRRKLDAFVDLHSAEIVKEVTVELSVELADYATGQALFYAFWKPWEDGLMMTALVERLGKVKLNTAATTPKVVNWGNETIWGQWTRGAENGEGNARFDAETAIKTLASVAEVEGTRVQFGFFNDAGGETTSYGARILFVEIRVTVS